MTNRKGTNQAWTYTCICLVLFVFNDFRREAVVRFVDICGVLDHHFLSFLFIALLFWGFVSWNNNILVMKVGRMFCNIFSICVHWSIKLLNEF